MQDAMKAASHDVSVLVGEYEVLVGQARAGNGAVNRAQLCELLASDADWTSEGAEILVVVARRYGTFLLRNALALAFALGVEDGDAGL